MRITAWDWIKLLITPFVLLTTGLFVNFYIKIREEKRSTEEKNEANKRLEQEAKIADQRMQNEVFRDYLKEMTSLFLNDAWPQPTPYSTLTEEELHQAYQELEHVEDVLPDAEGTDNDDDKKEQESRFGNDIAGIDIKDKKEARLVSLARARTLATLQALNGTLKGSLVHFLRDSKAFSLIFRPVIEIRNLDLSDATLEVLNFDDVWLPGANLKGIDLSYATFKDARLSESNFSEAKLFNCDFSGAALRYANLSQINALSTDFKCSDLFQANLSQANLSFSELEKTNLTGATLTEARLPMNLVGVTLCGETFGETGYYTKMERARLIFADLSQIKDGDLSYCDLTCAVLVGADLKNVKLNNSILLATDFREVQNLTPEQFLGPEPPLLCNTGLPEHIKASGIDPNRDRDKVMAVLKEIHSIPNKERKKLNISREEADKRVAEKVETLVKEACRIQWESED
jgi:uncharacterized protein YjbI with pentapeptide repeats